MAGGAAADVGVQEALQQARAERAKRKWRWPCQKEVEVAPVYDDVNCPYAVKPSALFKMSEVRSRSGAVCCLLCCCSLLLAGLWDALDLSVFSLRALHCDGLRACTRSRPRLSILLLLQDKDMVVLRELGGTAGLVTALGSHVQRGLEKSSIDEHRRVYGANTLPTVPSKNFLVLCFENIKDPIILLLVAAALVRPHRLASRCVTLCSEPHPPKP